MVVTPFRLLTGSDMALVTGYGVTQREVQLGAELYFVSV